MLLIPDGVSIDVHQEARQVDTFNSSCYVSDYEPKVFYDTNQAILIRVRKEGCEEGCAADVNIAGLSLSLSLSLSLTHTHHRTSVIFTKMFDSFLMFSANVDSLAQYARLPGSNEGDRYLPGGLRAGVCVCVCVCVNVCV